MLLTTEECDEHDTKCAEPGGFERLIAEEPEFARFVGRASHECALTLRYRKMASS